MAVGLGDLETALRIARAVAQAGGSAGTAELELAWLLGLFGVSPPAAGADLRRVQDALSLAGLVATPRLDAGPPEGRVTVELVARRFGAEPPAEVTAASAEEVDQGSRPPITLLVAAGLPVLATVVLGNAVGVAFLALGAAALVVARVRPGLLARFRRAPAGDAGRPAVALVAALTAVAAVTGYPAAAALERRAAAERREALAAASAAAAARERARIQAEQRGRAAVQRLREARERATERRAQERRRRARAARLRREAAARARARAEAADRARAQAEAQRPVPAPAPAPAPTTTPTAPTAPTSTPAPTLTSPAPGPQG